MYSTASDTVRIFSASSSGISISKASSKAITSSTVSRESAPKSSTNEALLVTSASSTPSCSTIICFTFSSTAAMSSPCVYGRDRAKLPAWRVAHSRQPPLQRHSSFGYFGVLIDIVDGILDGADLLSILIGNLQIECFFERHYQFNLVERIGA